MRSVLIFFVVRVRTRHGVRVREGLQLRVLIPRVLVVVVVTRVVFSLKLLRSGVCENGEVKSVAELGSGGRTVLVREGGEARVHAWAVNAMVAVRRTHVRASYVGSRCGLRNDFRRRRHHPTRAVVELCGLCGCEGCGLLVLVTPAGVGVGVYPGVPSELV